MAVATVIHFGMDEPQRVSLLRHAGYEVHESDSLDRLRRYLEHSHDVDAVIVSRTEPSGAEQAARLVRRICGAPLILFRHPEIQIDERHFDRVFSWQMPETHWLFEMAILVMQSKGLRAETERLRHEVQETRAETRRLLARAEAELHRFDHTNPHWGLAQRQKH